MGIEQFSLGLKNYGIEMEREDLELLWEEVASAESNEENAESDHLDFVEFTRMMTFPQSELQHHIKAVITLARENAHMLIGAVDENGDGTMSTTELFRVLNDINPETLNMEEVREMQRLVNAVDNDGNGDISFLEFLHLMNGPSTKLQVRALLRIRELREAFNE